MCSLMGSHGRVNTTASMRDSLICTGWRYVCVDHGPVILLPCEPALLSARVWDPEDNCGH